MPLSSDLAVGDPARHERPSRGHRRQPAAPCVSANDLALAREVVARYADLAGLADASIVVLGARHETRDILTLDERHFRARRTLDRKRFRLWPADH
jgi:hypothetical protein